MRTSLVFLLLCFAPCTFGQWFNNIATYTTQNGVSNNTITFLKKDSAGFLWIGTHEGLNRYDGTEFINVLSNSRNNLPSNNINKIAVINASTMAIGTDAGLCILNTNTLRGAEILLPFNPKFSAGSYQVCDILYKKETGELWVSTWHGLFVLNAEGKIIKKMMGAPSDMGKGYFAKNIFKDAKGEIYFFSQQRGGFFYPDFKSNMLVPVEQKDPASILNKMVRENYSLMGAQVCNSETVLTFSKKATGGYEEYVVYNNTATGRHFSDRLNIDMAVEKRVSNAFPLNDSILLVNSYFGQPMLYNSRTKKISAAASHALWFTSWPDGIGASFERDDQNIWIGTANGLLQVTAKENYFYTNTVLRDKVMENRSTVSFNYGIFYDNRFWLSCMGAGLFSLDTATNKLQLYFDGNTAASLNGKRISTKIIPSGKKIWLFSIYGPVQVDPFTKKLSPPDGLHKNEAFDASANNAFTDSRGDIWATLPDGITRYNSSSNLFTNFISQYKGGNFPLLKAGPKTEDGNGNIWMARQDTLVKYDPVKNSFTTFLLRKDGRIIRPVTAIASDGGNMLYIAAAGSFGIYNISNGSIELFRKQTGIISTAVNDMVSDKNGNAWIATEGGLVYYDRKKRRFSSFTKTDGLPDDNVVSINFTNKEKTQLFLGFTKTYCLFKPDNFLIDRTLPVNTITGVDVNGELLSINDATRAFSYLQNNISFTYTGINYNQGQQNNYACMLEGFDQDWKYTGTERKINYINLPPGKYTFKVKTADHQGKWNEQPATFSFQIAPPFWKRWWFRLLACIVAILSVYLFVKKREANLKKENSLKLQMSELRMQALRAQMNPHFIFNSLNSIQNYILTNNMIDAAGYLSKFAKLMRRILDQSKYNFLPIGEVMETLKLYVEIEAFRFNNEFVYSFEVPDDPELLETGIPPMLLQPFVENAILHGLMPKKGEKKLSVSCSIVGQHVQIFIDDNGIGRTQHHEKAGHSSQGEKLTTGMLESMQHMQEGSSSIEIIDRKIDGIPAGTTIKLLLPIN